MKLNRTTQRTVEILKLVSKNPEGITLDDICEKLELPKTSAYDIVTTLAEMGMVNVDRGQRQRYTIGLTAYRIGINYTNNLDFISVIEPELRAFAKEVGKTVFFGVRSDHDEETRRQVMGRIKFRQKTDRTIMDRASLLAELDRVRQNGYAFDAREMEEHMECVGAPVFGPDGSVAGAISVSSLYKPTENYELLGKMVSEKAQEVSKRLGFIGSVRM